MKIVRWMRAVPALFLLAFTLPVIAQAAAAQPEAILHPADLGKILPGFGLLFRPVGDDPGAQLGRSAICRRRHHAGCSG